VVFSYNPVGWGKKNRRTGVEPRLGMFRPAGEPTTRETIAALERVFARAAAEERRDLAGELARAAERTGGGGGGGLSQARERT